MPEDKIQCKLVESSLIVFDHDIATFLYTGGRYFGKPIGIRKPKPDVYYDKPLELSLIEGYYLLKKGKIEVLDPKHNRAVLAEELHEIAEKSYENFLSKYEIYEDLRDKGYIPRQD